MRMRELRPREYFGIMTCLVLVAVVGVGITIFNDGKTQDQPLTEIAENQTVEEPSQTVDANKNAPPISITDFEEESYVAGESEEIIEHTSPETSVAEETENTETSIVTVTEEDKLQETDSVAISDVEESVGEPVFDALNEETLVENSEELTLEWPVEGEIGLEFAMDSMVFDPTLEQYRTNDSVCILSEVGTTVKASADGIIKSVINDYKKGYTVVIEHKDGWVTTYSQLNENVAVKEGETISKGNVIGSVGNPTNHGIALGSHLDFKITQGSYSIDPKVAIAE